MCAVRALTEGKPKTWWPKEAGESRTGVILRMGSVESDFAPMGERGVPFIDLWQGGYTRLRIVAYSSLLKHVLAEVEPQIGDTLSVTFEGEKLLEQGRFAGRPYKTFRVEIQRGH